MAEITIISSQLDVQNIDASTPLTYSHWLFPAMLSLNLSVLRSSPTHLTNLLASLAILRALVPANTDPLIIFNGTAPIVPPALMATDHSNFPFLSSPSSGPVMRRTNSTLASGTMTLRGRMALVSRIPGRWRGI